MQRLESMHGERPYFHFKVSAKRTLLYILSCYLYLSHTYSGKVFAELVAEIVNSFVEPISYKTLVSQKHLVGCLVPFCANRA